MSGRSIVLDDIKRNPLIDAFLRSANENLGAIGYTEHGYRHARLVSHIAHNVLIRLKHSQRAAELAEIAGYCHDIGNGVGRNSHGAVGALLVATVLASMGMDSDEIAVISGAIGNHEEEVGSPVSPVSAALILADKTDVHRSRVRNPDRSTFDIHDRVNYAVVRSFLNVEEADLVITLELEVEPGLCSIMDYFEIFLPRMVMCRRAAELLSCQFKLRINGVQLL